MAQPALAASSQRPTVRIDGQPQSMVTGLIQAVQVTEQEGGMSSLELRLSNQITVPGAEASLAFEDEKILKLGTKVAIYCGDTTGTPIEVFRGKITAFEAEFSDKPPELVVLAEDVFQEARMTRRTKAWKDSSIADVAKAVAKQLNLTPKVIGLSDKFPWLVQLNESDLAFLRRLLTRHDADMQVIGDDMHVMARKDADRGAVDLHFQDEIRFARVLADLSQQVTEVTVTGWDYKQGRRINKKSTGSFLRPGQGRTGPTLLSDALGPRSEHVGDPGMLNDEEAQALADTIFDRRARPFVSVEATVVTGNPKVHVGTQVNLTGLGSRFSNSYYVVRCMHKYDLTEGYVTNFHAESAYLGAAS